MNQFTDQPIRFYSSLITLTLVISLTLVSTNSLASQQLIPKIQIAIILDTSNSMDGLIDQTRNQLWQVVNDFSNAKQDGVTPMLEIALFEYGNDSNTAQSGFVRRLNTFTRELDAVSESLFSLTTNGGSEYSGYAIQTAVNNLQWSRSSKDLKTIFIAGNEAFSQGPVDYREAIKLASQYDITINTIHAGSHEEGIRDNWKNGAVLAGGDYLSIDSNQKIVHIVAPQDEQIAKLNTKLNETYLPYGSQGAEKIQRQKQQDSQSGGISSGLLAKRAESKASVFYSNAQWDLVDALKDGAVDEETLAEFEDDILPEPLQGLSTEEKLDYVQEKTIEREAIKQEISELSRSRKAYIAEKKRAQVAAAPSIGDALSQAIRKQAATKSFEF